jgi:hypothetical protein
MLRAAPDELNLHKYVPEARFAVTIDCDTRGGGMNKEPIGRVRAQAGMRFALAAICSAAFVVFLLLLHRAVAQAPLQPLLDVRFSMLGVGINFALCLGSVVAFGYWRRRERARRSQNARG